MKPSVPRSVSAILMSRLLGLAGLLCLQAFMAIAHAQNTAVTSAPTHTLELAPGKAPAALDSGSIFFVGTATVILRYAGFTILTDPNFLHKGDHVHLGYGLKSKRLTDPAIPFDKLPPIDFVLLSHFHGDHFDQLVQKRLDRNTRIVTTTDSVTHLHRAGFKAVYPLRTWEYARITKGNAVLDVTAMPGRHGPPVVNRALPEVMGSMLDFRDASEGEARQRYRLYISGDTLVFDDLKDIPQRYPDINLALLHLGGTRAAGVLVTMDAEQGVEALKIVNPQRAIPIHYNDYDVFKSPLDDFLKAVKAAGWADRVTTLKHGETYNFKVPPRP